MIPEEVNERLRMLSTRYEVLRVYVLVDGIQYERRTGQPMAARSGAVVSLFEGTDDEPMARAGPWLVDPLQAPELTAQLAAMEPHLPGVIWLIGWSGVEVQAGMLRKMINAVRPDGRQIMLRFWDPRALASLRRTLSTQAWNDHFRGVLEWHFIENGNRLKITNDARN